jgi:hypothetical protein
MRDRSLQNPVNILVRAVEIRTNHVRQDFIRTASEPSKPRITPQLLKWKVAATSARAEYLHANVYYSPDSISGGEFKRGNLMRWHVSSPRRALHQIRDSALKVPKLGLAECQPMPNSLPVHNTDPGGLTATGIGDGKVQGTLRRRDKLGTNRESLELKQVGHI